MIEGMHMLLTAFNERFTNTFAAIDINLNNHVGIEDVNRFTDARPAGMTLLQWVTYNAYGELTGNLARQPSDTLSS